MLFVSAIVPFYLLYNIKRFKNSAIPIDNTPKTNSYPVRAFKTVFLRTWLSKWARFNTDPRYGVDWENIKLKTKDDVEIGTWVFKAKEQKKCIIMLHGITRNRAYFAKHSAFKHFVDAGYTVVIPDYRQFGDSGGKFEPDAVNFDIDAVHDYCSRIYEETFLIGHSFGGAVALKYCASVAGGYKNKVILISTFANLNEVLKDRIVYRAVRKMFPSIERRLKNEFYYDGLKDISTLDDKQVLLLHGKNDKMVLLKHTEQLGSVKNYDIKLFEKNNHNNILKNLDLVTVCKEFIEEINRNNE